MPIRFTKAQAEQLTEAAKIICTDSAMPPSIAVNSHWWGKQIEKEVTVTRVTAREVSYSAIDRPFAGTVPQ